MKKTLDGTRMFPKTPERSLRGVHEVGNSRLTKSVHSSKANIKKNRAWGKVQKCKNAAKPGFPLQVLKAREGAVGRKNALWR